MLSMTWVDLWIKVKELDLAPRSLGVSVASKERMVAVVSVILTRMHERNISDKDSLACQ